MLGEKKRVLAMNERDLKRNGYLIILGVMLCMTYGLYIT
jgi:hypothetical protein